jgi:hypothetical protein
MRGPAERETGASLPPGGGVHGPVAPAAMGEDPAPCTHARRRFWHAIVPRADAVPGGEAGSGSH